MTAGTQESWRGWLMSERPVSRRQAALGRAYAAWQTFARNRLAMAGLFIILALVLVAIFADQLAPYSPFAGALRTSRLLPPGTLERSLSPRAVRSGRGATTRKAKSATAQSRAR